MTNIKIPIILLFALLVCTLAWGGGGGGGRGGGGQGGYGGDQGFGGGGQGYGGQMSGGYQGNQGYGDAMGRSGRQFGGENGAKKYRSNLYNDDEVYGYDANYPNGEALYINYRSKDARARRGQEFARVSRAYSGRQGGGGGGGNYERSYGGGNGMSQMGRNGGNY